MGIVIEPDEEIVSRLWIFMGIGVYLLTSIPLPKLPYKIVADSSGVMKLIERKYSGKVFVLRETYVGTCEKAQGKSCELEELK